MSEVLHAGAIVPAVLGVCCVVGDRRRLVELAVGVVMVLAMLDMALGSAILAPAVWSLILVAMAGGLLLAEARGVVPACRHSAIGTALMGLCAAVMAVRGHVHTLAAEGHHVGHAHSAGHEVVLAGLLIVAVLGTAAYLPLTWRAVRAPEAPAAARIAAGSMAGSVLLMLFAVL